MMNAVVETQIRRATVDDLPTLVGMFQQFVSSTQYAKYVGQNPDFCAAQMARMLDADNQSVWVVDSEAGVIGMLGGIVFQQPFSGEIVASELFWWLDPEHRGHGGWLLKRFEKWAKSLGAVYVQMMAPVDKPRVAETYAALGYQAVESIFQKDLR